MHDSSSKPSFPRRNGPIWESESSLLSRTDPLTVIWREMSWSDIRRGSLFQKPSQGIIVLSYRQRDRKFQGFLLWGSVEHEISAHTGWSILILLRAVCNRDSRDIPSSYSSIRWVRCYRMKCPIIYPMTVDTIFKLTVFQVLAQLTTVTYEFWTLSSLEPNESISKCWRHDPSLGNTWALLLPNQDIG